MENNVIFLSHNLSESSNTINNIWVWKLTWSSSVLMCFGLYCLIRSDSGRLWDVCPLISDPDHSKTDFSSFRPSELQKHSQPHRPRLHPGSRWIRAGPGWPGSVQRPGAGDVRPTQAQVLGRGAETAAHDQESSQGLHPGRPEGNLELVLTFFLLFKFVF